MDLLLVVADLGRVKAFRLTRDEDAPSASPTFHDLLDVDLENRHSRVGERAADQAGRFPSGPSGMASGERHSEEQNARRAQLQRVANEIDTLASREEGSIYLSAPQPVLQQLLNALDSSVRQRVKKELALGLVKAPKVDLLARFELK